jgi:hypothetical protein
VANWPWPSNYGGETAALLSRLEKKGEVLLFRGERIDLQVLASLIACLGIERKETTAHVVEEQNRRGKLKGCAMAAEEERGWRRLGGWRRLQRRGFYSPSARVAGVSSISHGRTGWHRG